MSIAVSATVLPSRMLACMLVFMFALANSAVGYAGFCLKINRINFFAIVIVCVLLSVYFLLWYYRMQQAVRLDISDFGDIIFRSVVPNSLNVDPINVKLSERSTLWPQLMVLSLCSADRKTVVVPILRDSVDAETYRKLSVALNWIAMRTSNRTGFGADLSSGNF